MKESKVTREEAIGMLEQWLVSKKISKNKRTTLEDVEDEIVDAIEDGYLSLNKDMEWIFNLKFPLENTTQLKFAHRINVGKLESKLRKTTSEDIQGRIKIYVAVLTDQPNGIIQALDTADISIAGAIASYFF